MLRDWTSFKLRPGPNFIEVLRTKICLAGNFFLDKNRITNPFSICYVLLVTGIQLLFAYLENHVEIWLEIPFSLSQNINGPYFR